MTAGNRRNLVGIDLGTTISVIAHVEPHGAVTTLPNAEGEPLTTSAVYIDGTNVIVATIAFGRTCRNMITLLLTPRPRAARI